MNTIIKLLGNNLRRIMEGNIGTLDREAVEIRLRVQSPILIKYINNDIFVGEHYKIKKNDIDETIANITKNSIHAFENEIKNGYITIEGGHRVGLSGDCLYSGDNFNGFKNITSLNFRIAKEHSGCSYNYLKYFFEPMGFILNTLIIGPPLSGKTTFIRDVSSYLSDGIKNLNHSGCDITLIDERGEISAVYNGEPQMHVGKRTDILSYCQKKEGFFMSVRALSPRVIISDELGSKDDFEIVQYALKSGTNIITTAHGYSLDDISKNIFMKNIIENNFFDRAITLKNKNKPCVVKEVYDFKRNKVIFSDLG